MYFSLIILTRPATFNNLTERSLYKEVATIDVSRHALASQHAQTNG